MLTASRLSVVRLVLALTPTPTVYPYPYPYPYPCPYPYPYPILTASRRSVVSLVSRSAKPGVSRWRWST